jgi:hypothetical protein
LAENTVGAIDVPLALFGGKNSELAPSDIPEGVSPDNQDVAFLPGSVFSRPGLHKLFGTPMPNNATTVYAKSYVQPNGKPLNLILDSNGILWKEDVTASPGTYSLLLQTQPGTYAKSCTAFGREYIAISDGEHGADIPLQYDGTHLDRVTQDGPGANPCQVQDYAQEVNVVSIADRSSPQTIVAATQLGSTATIETANAHGLRADDLVLVDGVGVSGYNGTWKVTAVPSDKTFDYTPSASSLTASSGGTEYPLTVVVTTDVDHGLIVGDIVVITGNTNNAYNNNQSGTPSFWTISAVPSPTTFEFQRITGTGSSGFSVSVTVPGKAMPWSPTLNPSYAYGINDGTAAVTVPLSISAGNVLIIKATGTVTPSDSRPPAPPDGAPPATGSSGGSTGHHFPTLYMPGSVLGLCGVCGAMTNGSGVVVQPQSIGSSRTITTPVGATALQLGVNDDHYADNIGSFQVTVTLAAGGGTGGTGGTVSVGGLGSTGDHQVVVLFETRQGFQTAPSPPLKFTSAGLKKFQVSNVPIGPSNVTKRILAFTGAGGDNFFYIPVPAQEAGTVVSTSTVINNNIDTSVVVDFADNTLFAATAIDIPGNNLFEMQVLTPCSSFFNYASRLFAWGERNNVINFQNMGFDGGYDPLHATIPLGWTTETPTHPGGLLVDGDFGWAWQITGNGLSGRQGALFQAADNDYYGVQIIQPQTQYTARVWGKTSVNGAAGNLIVAITESGVGDVVVATIPLSSFSSRGNFAEIDFSGVTPDQFTGDLFLLMATEGQPVGQTAAFDELEIIYTADPYKSNTAKASYVNAPEQFDGLTGNIGPETDVTPIQCLDVLRDTLYFYTQSGIHSTNDNPGTEPYGWAVNQFANAVGVCSLFSEDRGEEWHVIATRSGPRVFDGSGPFKIGQEIQPDWESINWSAQKTIWVQNDVVERRIYFGVPIGSAVTPNKVLVLDYRELDTANQVAFSGPIRIGRGGQMVSSDFARKWTVWNVKANFGNTIVRPGNDQQMFFCGGNGLALGSGTGFGNIYYLDSAKLTDDNYGEIFPFYTTYFFVNHELEQALGTGSHRKFFQYLSLFVSGVGRIQVTPYVDSLSNNWPSTPAYTLSADATFDLEFGLQVSGERCAFKIVPVGMPNQTDKKFNLQKMVVTLRQDAVTPIRGAI